MNQNRIRNKIRLNHLEGSSASIYQIFLNLHPELVKWVSPKWQKLPKFLLLQDRNSSTHYCKPTKSPKSDYWMPYMIVGHRKILLMINNDSFPSPLLEYATIPTSTLFGPIARFHLYSRILRFPSLYWSIKERFLLSHNSIPSLPSSLYSCIASRSFSFFARHHYYLDCCHHHQIKAKYHCESANKHAFG